MTKLVLNLVISFSVISIIVMITTALFCWDIIPFTVFMGIIITVICSPLFINKIIVTFVVDEVINNLTINELSRLKNPQTGLFIKEFLTRDSQKRQHYEKSKRN